MTPDASDPAPFFAYDDRPAEPAGLVRWKRGTPPPAAGTPPPVDGLREVAVTITGVFDVTAPPGQVVGYAVAGPDGTVEVVRADPLDLWPPPPWPWGGPDVPARGDAP
jgi:hypothetical protein